MCNYSYTIWWIQYNPAITWEFFTKQFTHKYCDQVKQKLTKNLGNAVIAFFLIPELNFFASSIMMTVMKINVKTTPITGYRYTVNDGSGWKNEKHQWITSSSAVHVFIVGFVFYYPSVLLGLCFILGIRELVQCLFCLVCKKSFALVNCFNWKPNLLEVKSFHASTNN